MWRSWEGRYQKTLGVCWGSGMLAGKMAGYCSRLFDTNCWAEQTAFIARGDSYDEFIVGPSERYRKVFADHVYSGKAMTANMFVQRPDGERVPVDSSGVAPLISMVQATHTSLDQVSDLLRDPWSSCLRMLRENGWDAPRIHAELLKLGFKVHERTVSRYIPKQPTAPDELKR